MKWFYKLKYYKPRPSHLPLKTEVLAESKSLCFYEEKQLCKC